MSEHLDAAERSLKIQGKEFSIQDRYIELMKQYYGVKVTSFMLRNKRTFSAFKWVMDYCTENEVDITVWMTAQMYILKRFIAEQAARGGFCKRFMPSMLTGDKAKARYNMYVRKMNKMFKRAQSDSSDSDKYIMKVLTKITESEDRIATVFILSMISQEPVSWEFAVSVANPCAEWYAFNLVPCPVYYQEIKNTLQKKFSFSDLSRLKNVAQLRAACQILSRYHFRLPDRVGMNKFTWEGIVTVIRKMLDFSERGSVVVLGAAADEWRPGNEREH